MPLSRCSVPSGARITLRQAPPGRSSPSEWGTVNPLGAHHLSRCSLRIHAWNTRLRGASKTRVTSSALSPIWVAALGFAFAAILLLLRLQFAQVIVQAIETLLPESAVTFQPVVHLLERTRLDAAGPPLRLAPAQDQAGALQHLEMLGDGGKAHVEGFGEFRHRGFAGRKPRQNGPARRIGQGREGGAEAIRCWHA